MKNNYFEVQKFTIDGIDVAFNELKSFTIYSDIDSIGLQISILYNDITDLKTNLPLKGGELIELLLQDKYGKVINHKYVLTSIDEISNKTVTKDSLIKLNGITEDSFKLITQRLYTSYLNKTPSEIVSDIDSKIDTQQTSNKGDFLCPGWSKNKFIQYLTKVAFNDKGSNFLFYEDIDGMKFKSLNELLNITDTYAFDINNRNEQYRYNIHSLEEINNFNVLENTYQNMYINTFVSYNPNKKIIEKTIIDSTKLENKKLGKGAIINDKILEYQTPSRSSLAFHDIDTFTSQSEHDIIFNGYSKRLDLLLNGDLERVVGEVIFINRTNRIKQNEFDNENAGTWIIEKIAYHFSNSDFKMKVRVTRNSVYDAPIKTKNPISLNIKN